MALTPDDGNIGRYVARVCYSKVQLNEGALNTLYFTEAEFVAASGGAGDAGKPVKLNGSGLIDATMMVGGSVTTHAALTATHGATGAVVGTTNSQTLTNKTITAPTISAPTINGVAAKIIIDASSGDPALALHENGVAKYTLSYVPASDYFAITETGVANRLVIKDGGKIGINSSSPAISLDVGGVIRSTNAESPATGEGLQLSFDTSGHIGQITSYDYGASAYRAIWSNALSHTWLTSGSIKLALSSTTLALTGNLTVSGTIDLLTTHAALTAAHGATGAVVGTTNTQTLTGKTLTAPVIATIVNSGTLTLPTSTDTLVGRATTDTLSNKTLASPAITGNLSVATNQSIYVGGPTDTGTAGLRLLHSTNDAYFDHKGSGGFNFRSNNTDGSTVVATLGSTGLAVTTATTSPIVYGSSAANGDLAINGTSSGTKTTSYVQLQPTGGGVVVGGTTTDHAFEVQHAGADNFRMTMNLNASGINYFNSYNAAPGGFTAAPLNLFASRVTIDQGIFNISTGNAPASSGAAGNTGDLAWGSGFIYVCVSPSSWRRATLNTF